MVYFITDGHYTKIGKANNPELRLLELQTGNAKRLSIKIKIDGGNEIERKLHKLFHRKRINGEWFLLDFNYNKEDIIEFLSLNFSKENKHVGVVAKLKIDKNKNDVLKSIFKLNNKNIEITPSNISDDCNLSIRTVKKYINILNNKLNIVNEHKIILNSKVELKDKKMIQLKEAKDSLITKGLKVNVLSLSKITNISRITVNKYWDELKKL